ncbi:MAG: L-serine ammonia-lyase, iron-sulfur-dependent, subunit alpha, partial [Acidaminococcaceae bacterium]|nr:L-serine ammonia-lyase, iron-sulfur-dependent, subunit alpha [Acidaminococcaceae bacterium]
VKNVKAVIVPHSGGGKGIAVAAVLGVLGGDAAKELAVLEDITQSDIDQCNSLMAGDFCSCELIENVANLYIVIQAQAGKESAEVVIKDYHSNIAKIIKNGKVLFTKEHDYEKSDNEDFPDKTLLNVKDILEFADAVKIDDVRKVLDRQIEFNCAIAAEGMRNPYGAEVGRTLMSDFDTNNVKLRAKALAAAGSDARMSGCPLPVVINSGSGNQGITVSIPVIEYAKELNVGEEKLYRSLVVSNLIALHQKRFIGSLSAYCGAVSAGCGSGAGIAYMMGMNYSSICDVITNSITNVGGMVCDGAKPSCAAKIAISVETAILALHLSKKKHVFHSGEGLVKDDIEQTIESVGRMGRVGMKSTDIEILNIMLGKINIAES